jgi:molybdenum cofactor cytidylyltransferase
MTSEIVGILLAAGASSRFGGNKLLYPLDNGMAVGVAAAQRLIAVIPKSLAVVKPSDDTLPPLLAAQGLSIVVNDRAREGLGSSLACGIAAAPEAKGWVVALADMPLIQAATIELVVNRLRNGAAIVAPVYNGRRGHPVGFSERFFKELTHLQTDRGARDLLKQYADILDLVEVGDRGILMDLDHRDANEVIQTTRKP